MDRSKAVDKRSASRIGAAQTLIVLSATMLRLHVVLFADVSVFSGHIRHTPGGLQSIVSSLSLRGVTLQFEWDNETFATILELFGEAGRMRVVVIAVSPQPYRCSAPMAVHFSRLLLRRTGPRGELLERGL